LRDRLIAKDAALKRVCVAVKLEKNLLGIVARAEEAGRCWCPSM
jgi:hypothetical protein